MELNLQEILLRVLREKKLQLPNSCCQWLSMGISTIFFMDLAWLGGIPPLVLKGCAAELLPVLCKLLFLFIAKGICPKIWKNVWVQQILKKWTLPANYTPRAMKSNCSTGDLQSHISHIYSNTIEKYIESQTVALDISQPLDQVWPEDLLVKLPVYGLSYEHCIHFIVDGITSQIYPVNASVPQSSILPSPLIMLQMMAYLHFR